MAVELDPTDASRAHCLISLIRPCFASVVLFCALSNRAEATSGEESCSTTWKIRLVVEITGRRCAEDSEFGTD